MVCREDWSAALSSEVFRIFAENELRKDAEKEEIVKKSEANIVDAFEQFQKSVNASPKLRGIFKKLQHDFMTNPDVVSKTDPKFVEGVLLLDIEGE